MSTGKLTYITGVMGSGKSEHLLKKVQELESQNKIVLSFKPEIDTRNGNYIKSRSKIKPVKAVTINEDDREKIFKTTMKSPMPDIVLVDEVNFFKIHQIMELFDVVEMFGIDVFTYGLKTDFKNEVFKGSNYLLKYADEVIELDAKCKTKGCKNNAIVNMRLVDGKPVTDGEQFVIGDVGNKGEISYKPVCESCWNNIN